MSEDGDRPWRTGLSRAQIEARGAVTAAVNLSMKSRMGMLCRDAKARELKIQALQELVDVRPACSFVSVEGNLEDFRPAVDRED